MARTGQSVIDRAWIIAQDAGKPSYGAAIGATPGIRWSPVEALMWLNDMQIEIVRMLPRANAKRATPTAAAGTRQTLAGLGLTDGLSFIDVVCNYSADGVTRGRPITEIKRVFLDDAGRYWHNEQAAEAYHWTQDEDDPTAIYISPAITGSGKLEVIYAAMPTDLTALSEPIGLHDQYATALMYGVVSRFFSKDATYGKNTQVAAGFLSLMQQSLGISDANETALDARRTAKAAGK
jgi:hypothetical protein